MLAVPVEELPGAGALDDLCGNQNFTAFVLNRRVILHAIDAMPARWRGDAGSSPLDGLLVDFHTARDGTTPYRKGQSRASNMSAVGRP